MPFSGCVRKRLASSSAAPSSSMAARPFNSYTEQLGRTDKKASSIMEIKRVGSQPSATGPSDWFTGTVRIDPLFQAPDPALVQGASVTFEPGARTAWHTHPLGQTLIVTAGCGWVQREGGPIRSEEHTSELQSRGHLVCRLLLEKKKN